MKLIGQILFEVNSEDEFERLKDANKLPNEEWHLVDLEYQEGTKK